MASKILILDSAPRFCDSLRTLLGSRGYEVHARHGGQDALSFLANEKVDLVLLDMLLPDSGGPEVLDRIDPRHSGMPVIVLTDHVAMESAREAMRKGAYDYLGKPLNKEELLKAVESALAQKRRGDERRRENGGEDFPKRRLEALWNIARMVDADHNTLCDHVLAEVLEMTQSQYAFYGFLDQDERVMTTYSWSDGALAECRVRHRPIYFPVAQAGIWAEAVKKRKPILINDYAAPHPAKKRTPQGHVPIANLLSVPIFSHGKIVAVVAVANKDSGYEEDDARQIEAFATNVQVIIDRRKAEEGQREIAGRYLSFVQNFRGIAFRGDANFRPVFLHGAVEEITGYGEDDFVSGRIRWDQIIDKEDLPRILDSIDKCISQPGGFAEREYRIVRKDGRKRWVCEIIQKLCTDSGGPQLVEGAIYDITDRKGAEGTLRKARDELEKKVEERTRELAEANEVLKAEIIERKRAEEALRASESRYRKIFESVPVSIWEEDFAEVKSAIDALKEQGVKDIRKYFGQHPEFVREAAEMVKILNVNELSLRMYKARNKDELSGSLSRVLLPESLGVFSEELIALVEGKAYFEAETVNQSLEGDKINVLVRISFQNQGPEFQSALLSIMDITSRKHAEEALRDSQELLERTFASLNEAVFVLDAAARRIIACNPAVEHIFGYSEDEVVGRNAEFLHVSKKNYDLFGNELFSALDAGEIFNTDFQMRRKDGSVFFTEHTVTEILDHAGKRTGLVSVVLDITERKRAGEALKLYTKKLEASNRDLEDFAFVASHDLKEPLRKIQTFGSLLMGKHSDQLDEQGRDYILRMETAANRMQELLSALLRYSRIASQDVTVIPVDTTRLVEEAASDLEPFIQKAQGIIHIASLPSVKADPSQLRQLFQNLITNAIKFRRPGVKPTVRVYGRMRDDGRCQIFVEDNGIGFDNRHLDRIFKPFQRLHGRSEYEGSGMGLAICRKIMERHAGEISAVSTPGEGSTFIVTLPAILNRKGR